MKYLSCLLFLIGAVAASAAVERISLGAGRAALLAVPESWTSAGQPEAPKISGTATIRFVPKSGANEAVVITFITAPDELLTDAESYRTAAEMSARRFARGSVEGRADFKEFKVGGRVGFACLFTDAKLVGKPPVPEDYKTMTHCFVYLGDRVLLMASIFSDDPAGPDFAAARKILQSITLTLPQNTI